MLVLRILFPSGRYNFTEHNEWPPSPFLLARSLALACLRDIPQMQGNRLENLLNLFSCPVRFALPAAVTHFSGQFLSISENQPMFMEIDASPSREELFDLKQLLCFVKTLGVNPTWIDGDLSVESSLSVNCTRKTSHINGKSVLVNTLVSRENYNEIRAVFPSDMNWIESIVCDKAVYQKLGCVRSPSQVEAEFIIAPGVLREEKTKNCSCALFSLESESLPAITGVLSFAESVRRKLMGINRRLNSGDPALISQVFSGKTSDGTPLEKHRHVFILPYSSCRKGKIDKLLICSYVPFSEREFTTVQNLNTIQNGNNSDVTFILDSFTEFPLFKAKKWISVTPFVTSRHHRRSRGSWEDWMESELKRELPFHNLSSSVSVRMQNSCSGEKVSEFVVSRKGVTNANATGFSLSFEKEQQGPFALGGLCHFGLGLFMPEE